MAKTECEICGKDCMPVECPACPYLLTERECSKPISERCPRQPCSCEVPYDELEVGQRYKLEHQEDSIYANPYENSIVTITRLTNMSFWCDHSNCFNGCCKGAYKFYKLTGSDEPNKEQDMKTTEGQQQGQILYKTAIAEIVEDKDGNKRIAEVTQEVTKDAEKFSQAMIARHTAVCLAAKTEKDLPQVVGKNGNNKWVRMDEI